jgi:hypothetical protein
LTTCTATSGAITTGASIACKGLVEEPGTAVTTRAAYARTAGATIAAGAAYIDTTIAAIATIAAGTAVAAIATIATSVT